MPRKFVRPIAAPICDDLRSRIVADLRRILAAHGEGEALGSAPRRIEVLRANVRAELNKVCETAVDLLAHNQRVREVCGLLLANLADRAPELSDAERFRCETQLEGQINDLQALELTHAMTSTDRARLIHALHDYRALLDGWIASEETTQYRATAAA